MSTTYVQTDSFNIEPINFYKATDKFKVIIVLNMSYHELQKMATECDQFHVKFHNITTNRIHTVIDWSPIADKTKQNP